ncbi:MAG TPA: ComEC/Rec2 family competence protein [Gaiellaceae bacterium]|nr:ComEC/Rec2 family competence protein [Gaiellaceae bacterium]
MSLGRPVPAHLLAAALCAGLAAADLGRVGAAGLGLGLALAAGAAACASPAVRLVLAAAGLAAVGWWWGSARLDTLDRSALRAEIGRAGRAVVVVTSPVRRGRYDQRASGSVRSFRGVDAGEPVELELPLGRSPPQGAVLEALALVKEPRGPSHGFDERTWLRRHGMHVVLRLDGWRVVGRRGGLGGLADRLRRALARAIAPGLAGERRAVLEGIVLGDDSALGDGLRADFRRSGLYHLLAVSGQNVVLVAGGVLVLAWLLGASRVLGELGALAAIGAYVLAVGAQPSVVRAGVAGALASLAWLTGRLRDAWQALLLGAVCLLAWNPYLLLDVGFQLSFAAVAAIFVLAPRLARALEPWPLPRSVRLGVAVSAACGLATAPVLWLQLGYLPVLGVAANALAEPAMPVLLGLAFATAALEPVAPAAAALVAWLNGLVAAYLALCAHAIGALPFAQVSTARGLAGLVGMLLAAAYAWRRWPTS